MRTGAGSCRPEPRGRAHGPQPFTSVTEGVGETMSARATERKRLGELLLEEGLINREQLQEALAVQRRTGRRLGAVLAKLGFVTEEQVADALARRHGLKRVRLDELTVPQEVLQLVPRELMDRYEVFPLAAADDVLQLAMVDPLNIYALDDIARATKRRIEPFLATAGEWRRPRDFGVAGDRQSAGRRRRLPRLDDNVSGPWYVRD